MVELCPVLQEVFLAYVGERMLDELLEDFEGHRAHISARLGSVHHVQRVTQRGSQNLRPEAVVAIYGDDVVVRSMPTWEISSSRPRKGLT